MPYLNENLNNWKNSEALGFTYENGFQWEESFAANPTWGNGLRFLSGGFSIMGIGGTYSTYSSAFKFGFGMMKRVNLSGLNVSLSSSFRGTLGTGINPFSLSFKYTSKTTRQLNLLRTGTDVTVRNIDEARNLLKGLPELRPHKDLYPNMNHTGGSAANAQNPFANLWQQPRGTFRGDLINSQNPLGIIHPGNTNPLHANFPHYNLRFFNGQKSAIIITGN